MTAIRHIGIQLWALTLIVIPLASSAYHEPLIAAEAVIVSDASAPKAYYGQLQGSPHVYHIESTEPFLLSLRLITPDSQEGKPDLMAAVLESGKPDEPLAVLNGTAAPWEASEESFQGLAYLRGPAFERDLEAGIYEVRVWSSNNDSAYGLLIGEKEEDIGFPSALCIFLSIVLIGLIIAVLVWIRRRSDGDEEAPVGGPASPSPGRMSPSIASAATPQKSERADVSRFETLKEAPKPPLKEQLGTSSHGNPGKHEPQKKM